MREETLPAGKLALHCTKSQSEVIRTHVSEIETFSELK